MTNRKKRMESSEKSRPEVEFRINGVKAVVWKNETRNGAMFNTSLVRIYKNGDDEWQETHSLGRDDLLAAAKALDQAHSFIVEEERTRRNEEQSD